MLSPPPAEPAVTWVECSPGYVCLTVADARLVYSYLDAVDRWSSETFDLCSPE